jgi:hypothetical protein
MKRFIFLSSLLLGVMFANVATAQTAQVDNFYSVSADVGWESSAVDYTAGRFSQAFEQADIEFNKLEVYAGFKSKLQTDLHSIQFSQISILQNYGAIEISNNPLHGDTGRQRSNECGYTQMALIPAADRAWLETSRLYRPYTLGWQSGTACSKQRRC